MSSLDRLSAMNTAYKEAQVREHGELPPDGEYQAQVTRVAIEVMDKWEGEPLVLLTDLEVTSADAAGWPIGLVHNLEDAERIEWTKKHLWNLGFDRDADLTALDDLATRQALVGNIVNVAVVTNKAGKADKNGRVYRNAYVNGVVIEMAAAKDDIPF